MPTTIIKSALALTLLLPLMTQNSSETKRPHARDIGLVVGVLPAGRLDAITDVDGVRVGHATVIKGADVRTGVTAIPVVWWTPRPLFHFDQVRPASKDRQTPYVVATNTTRQCFGETAS